MVKNYMPVISFFGLLIILLTWLITQLYLLSEINAKQLRTQ